MYAEERQHEIVTRARELGRVAVAASPPATTSPPRRSAATWTRWLGEGS